MPGVFLNTTLSMVARNLHIEIAPRIDAAFVSQQSSLMKSILFPLWEQVNLMCSGGDPFGEKTVF